MSKKTVFISAYRNVTIRYLVHTGILERLSEHQDTRWVVFLQDANCEYYASQFQYPNVTIEPILYETAFRTLKRNPLLGYFMRFRKCFTANDNGEKNPTNEGHLRWLKMETGFHNRWIRFPIVLVISRLAKWSHFLRMFLRWCERSLFAGRIYDPVFKKYKPAVTIVSSMGSMIDPQFMAAARRNGSKVVSLIHNWDNSSSKEYCLIEPDHVVVWNERMRKEVQIFHDVPIEKVKAAGVAVWDHYFDGRRQPISREAFFKSSCLSSNKKTIFFGTSSYKHHRNTFQIIERICQSIAQGRFSQPTQLLVRLHPAYTLKGTGGDRLVIDKFAGQLEDLKNRFGDLIEFDLPAIIELPGDVDFPIEGSYRLHDILTHSDVLVNEYSTLTIEGAIFDLPIINVRFNPILDMKYWTHFISIQNLGAYTLSETFDELDEQIEAALTHPKLAQQARRMLVDFAIDTHRGSASKNVADHLSRYVSEVVGSG